MSPGTREAFPETAWSTILGDPDPASPRRREKLEALCADYWRPVYSYIRAAWRKPDEEAQDLTQGYFCHLLETDLLAGYEPAKGRFRHFVLGTLKKFLTDEHRRANALKRGGDHRTVRLPDPDELERFRRATPEEGLEPEEAFHRQWTRDVLARAISALAEECRRDGREKTYLVYEAYDLARGTGAPPTYASIAVSLGLSVTDVTNHLHACRSRLGELVARIVGESVTTHEELLEEMRDLFSR